MSEREEQSNFKITDKRMFNPDGTLRDSAIEADEAESPATSEPAPAPPRRTRPEPVPDPPRSAAARLEPEPTPAATAPPEQQMPEFIEFIYGLATNAFANLGLMPHPMTGESTVDLETAKHFIDILGMLETKTKGNLTNQEAQLMTEILRDLRLQYVSLLNAPKGKPNQPR